MARCLLLAPTRVVTSGFVTLSSSSTFLTQCVPCSASSLLHPFSLSSVRHCSPPPSPATATTTTTSGRIARTSTTTTTAAHRVTVATSIATTAAIRSIWCSGNNGLKSAGSPPTISPGVVNQQQQTGAQQSTEDLARQSPEIEGETSELWCSPPPPPGTAAADVRWSHKEVRTGVIGVKIGMTALFDPHYGKISPATVVKLDAVQVMAIRENVKPGLNGLWLASQDARAKHVSRADRGQFAKAAIPCKRKVAQFNVTPNAVVPIGTKINVWHFVPGQYVDVQGKTKYKGFQGVMKRHGFSGQPASHGVSRAHRSLGSTGMRQSPGRVFPGKKMPGHMGNENQTQMCVKVLKLDAKRNLLFLKGQIQGPKGGWLRLRDSIWKHSFDYRNPPPFPTYFRQPGDSSNMELWAPPEETDPLQKLLATVDPRDAEG